MEDKSQHDVLSELITVNNLDLRIAVTGPISEYNDTAEVAAGDDLEEYETSI